MRLLKKQEQRKSTETFFILIDWRGITEGENGVIMSDLDDNIYAFSSYEDANRVGNEHLGTFEIKKITRTFTQAQFFAVLQLLNKKEGGSSIGNGEAYDNAEKAYNEGLSVSEYFESIK